MPLWFRFLCVVGIFFLLHCLIQFSTPFFADTDDSYYHAKMALMIWENGIIKDFPWLYFTTLHSSYVDHHFLFHVILIPFVLLGKFIYGAEGYLGLFWGAKMGVVFGIALATGAFYLLLESMNVRFRLVWLLFFLAVPYDFYFRLHMVRVQSYSLFVMLLGLWALFEKKYWLLGLLCFLYVTLYGGAFFLPIFIGIYAIVRFLTKRTYEYKPLLWGGIGMLLGFLTDPYLANVFGFLKQQIFETGLGYQTTDLNVGGEWRPYDTWYIFQMGWVTFTLLGVSIFWSLYDGTKQKSKTLTVLFINLFFLVLMWKSKRFVEYWPAFAVLSSSYLLAPVLEKIKISVGKAYALGISVSILGIGFLYLNHWQPLQLLIQKNSFFIAYPAFIYSTWSMLSFIAVFFIIWVVVSFAEERMKKVEKYSLMSTVLLSALIAALPFYILSNMSAVVRDIQPHTAYIQGAKSAMECILTKGEAKKGDIVMTDDWDVFPLFFFYNHVTNYIMGLDPVFMYKFDKKLYKQFADITIGTDGAELPHKIKDIFKARFVVMDADHSVFRANIERYPESFQKLCENGQFTVFQVK